MARLKDADVLASAFPDHMFSLCSVNHLCMIKKYTVFPRIDAAAFICFVGQFGAATIRGRRLFF